MEELNSSELGTREYWEEAYKRELKEFEARGDPGEVWFGEDSVIRVVNWLGSNKKTDSSVIDLGCGNGYSLIELTRKGFTNLTGVDYSPEAIHLACKLAEKEDCANIAYKVFDITTEDTSELGKFSIVHDKGTYDAISLNPGDAKTKREQYIDSVVKLLDENGIFVITSCNWTDQELAQHFTGKLELSFIVPTPQFKFGGRVGNIFTSAIFIANDSG